MNHRSIFACALISTTLALGCSMDDTGESEGEAAPSASTQAAPVQIGAQKQAAGRAPAATSRAATAALTSAHDAYLGGDFVAMGERLHDVLGDARAASLVRANALELLDKAFEVGEGSLPSSFAPPPGFAGLQYACFHVATPHGASWHVRFRGVTPDASHITGVSTSGAGLVMDKAGGKGRYSIRHDPGTKARGLEEFVLDSGRLEAPPTDGVVHLAIALDDGSTFRGFVLTHGFCSSTAPDARWPASAASTDPRPAIGWSPFRSPEFRPFERRRTLVQVNKDGVDAGLWEHAEAARDDDGEVRIGSAAGIPDAPLVPGLYWASLSGVESRKFGPVEVLRISRTVTPFRVLP